MSSIRPYNSNVFFAIRLLFAVLSIIICDILILSGLGLVSSVCSICFYMCFVQHEAVKKGRPAVIIVINLSLGSSKNLLSDERINEV